MFNHNRGLWGYTGTAADGEPMTIQSTGMGGPSAAIVLEELCDLGLETAIRVGTCGALDADLRLGDLVIADAALACRRREPRARARTASSRPTPALVAALQARRRRGGRADRRRRDQRPLLRPRSRALARAGARPARSPSRWRPRRCCASASCAASASAACWPSRDVFDADGARRRIDADALLKAAERLGGSARRAGGESAVAARRRVR